MWGLVGAVVGAVAGYVMGIIKTANCGIDCMFQQCEWVAIGLVADFFIGIMVGGIVDEVKRSESGD